MTSEDTCPLCGCASSSVYIEGTDPQLVPAIIGSSRRSVDPGRILRCSRCGLGFRLPRPTAADLAKLYHGMDDSVYEAEARGRRHTACKHLSIVHRFLKPGRILDVGCASGRFLSVAVAAGWIARGIEPSRSLSRRAQEALGEGVVHPVTLEEIEIQRDSFDAVTLWDLLEHVADPLFCLRKCRTLLRPGGHVFANVPDLDSLQARMFGRRWPLILPEHLQYFNRKSLRIASELTDLHLVTFGRRRSVFSLGYILSRLQQHRVPATRFLSHMVQANRLKDMLLPVPLGEIYAVWQKPYEHAN